MHVVINLLLWDLLNALIIGLILLLNPLHRVVEQLLWSDRLGSAIF